MYTQTDYFLFTFLVLMYLYVDTLAKSEGIPSFLDQNAIPKMLYAINSITSL